MLCLSKLTSAHVNYQVIHKMVNKLAADQRFKTRKNSIDYCINLNIILTNNGNSTLKSQIT